MVISLSLTKAVTAINEWLLSRSEKTFMAFVSVFSTCFENRITLSKRKKKLNFYAPLHEFWILTRKTRGDAT